MKDGWIIDEDEFAGKICREKKRSQKTSCIQVKFVCITPNNTISSYDIKIVEVLFFQVLTLVLAKLSVSKQVQIKLFCCPDS